MIAGEKSYVSSVNTGKGLSYNTGNKQKKMVREKRKVDSFVNHAPYRQVPLLMTPTVHSLKWRSICVDI